MYPAAYQGTLQLSQHYFRNDILMTFQELDSGLTIQQVVHRDFTTLQQLGYEVTVLTPMERIDTYRRAAYLATTTTAGPSLSRTTRNIH